MYKWFFVKPNIELGKSYLSVDSWVSELHIQIFKLHMHIVPGPASQDAVIRCAYTLRQVYSVEAGQFQEKCFLFHSYNWNVEVRMLNIFHSVVTIPQLNVGLHEMDTVIFKEMLHCTLTVNTTWLCYFG
jgi:hypothetical protein